MNVSDKLEHFSNLALQEAKEEKEKLKLEIEATLNESVEQFTKEAQIKADIKIQNEAFKVAHLKNKEVIKATVEAKKSYTSYRNQLIDQLFESVRKKLEDFMCSNKYLDYFIKEIGSAIEKYPEATVLLMERDMHLADAIKEKLNVSIEGTKEDFVGGFKLFIQKKNATCSFSFADKLELARSDVNFFKTDHKEEVV